MAKVVDSLDSLIAKPKPKADVRHLMGRPLVPFFVPGKDDVNEQLTFAAPCDSATAGFSIAVREFRDGYFQDAQAQFVPSASPAVASSSVRTPPAPSYALPAKPAATVAAVAPVASAARKLQAASPTSGRKRKSKQGSSSSVSGRSLSAISGDAASSKYAGAAFCNTPAPSAIPMPSLMSQVPASSILLPTLSSAAAAPAAKVVDFPDVSKPTVLAAAPVTKAPVPASRAKLIFLGPAAAGSTKTAKVEINLAPSAAAAPAVAPVTASKRLSDEQMPVLSVLTQMSPEGHTVTVPRSTSSTSGSSEFSAGSPIFRASSEVQLSPPDAHEPSLRQMSESLKQLLLG